MTRLSTTEARDKFSDILSRVSYGGERVCVTRQGKDVACLVSMREVELLDLLEDRIDLIDALEALREAEEEGVTPWEDLKVELGL